MLSQPKKVSREERAEVEWNKSVDELTGFKAEAIFLCNVSFPSIKEA